MTPAMKDYWMRILAAFFLLKMASTLVRDAEKMMAQSLRAKDDEVAAVLNGNGKDAEYVEVWVQPESPSEDETEVDTLNTNTENNDA